MPAYDTARFQSPAPVALVTLRDPATSALVADVPMLLDSGADVSLVPEAVVRQIGVTPTPGRQYQLVAFDGTVSFAPVVSSDRSWIGCWRKRDSPSFASERG